MPNATLGVMPVKVANLQRPLRKLPRRRRWRFGGSPLDWDFSMKTSALRPLDKAAYDFPLKPAWLLDVYLGKGRRLPEDIDRSLQAIDRTAYDRSDWKPFVAFVRGE